MAKFKPESLGDSVPDSERRVRQELARLGDDWWVLHSVPWEAPVDGARRDGEADFVLIHARGVVIMEVKGGRIDVRNGRWYSTDRNDDEHEIKNPFLQAAQSKRTILRYLKTCDPALPYLNIVHCVAFPDVADPGSLGPAAPREISIGTQRLNSVAQVLEELLPSEDALSSAQVMRVAELLAPTVTCRPLLRDAVERANEELLRLTEEQIHVLDQLRRNDRMMVYGSAGTGKTVLAVERARRLASAGFDVLLTCFNRPLGDRLKEALSHEPRIRVASFHSFVASEAVAAQIRLPDLRDPSWDDAAVNALDLVARTNGTKFDALVIDEAQDFSAQWFMALALLLGDPDAGPFYAFADTAQAIYRPDWEPPFKEPSFELLKNCRNTVQIATVVAGVYNAPVDSLGAQGPEPRCLLANDSEAMRDCLRLTLHELLNNEKLGREQIVVLSTRKADVIALRGTTVAGCQLAEPGTPNCVGVDTVHRFKGLEADAVVLLLPEYKSGQDQALAYIGMSRARAVLVVIGPEPVWR